MSASLAVLVIIVGLVVFLLFPGMNLDIKWRRKKENPPGVRVNFDSPIEKISKVYLPSPSLTEKCSICWLEKTAVVSLEEGERVCLSCAKAIHDLQIQIRARALIDARDSRTRKGETK